MISLQTVLYQGMEAELWRPLLCGDRMRSSSEQCRGVIREQKKIGRGCDHRSQQWVKECQLCPTPLRERPTGLGHMEVMGDLDKSRSENWVGRWLGGKKWNQHGRWCREVRVASGRGRRAWCLNLLSRRERLRRAGGGTDAAEEQGFCWTPALRGPGASRGPSCTAVSLGSPASSLGRSGPGVFLLLGTNSLLPLFSCSPLRPASSAWQLILQMLPPSVQSTRFEGVMAQWLRTAHSVVSDKHRFESLLWPLPAMCPWTTQFLWHSGSELQQGLGSWLSCLGRARLISEYKLFCVFPHFIVTIALWVSGRLDEMYKYYLSDSKWETQDLNPGLSSPQSPLS